MINEAYRKFIEGRLEAGESLEIIEKSLETVFLTIQDQCMFCDEKATHWCDYIFAWEHKSTYKGQRRACLGSKMFTCDAAMCEEHRTPQEPLFICSRQKNQSEVVIDDFCPAHSNPLKPKEDIQILTASEAGQKRAHKFIRYLSKKT